MFELHPKVRQKTLGVQFTSLKGAITDSPAISSLQSSSASKT